MKKVLVTVIAVTGIVAVAALLTCCRTDGKGEIMLNKGIIAPDFTLTDQNGKEHTLSAYRGQWVLLYFYPKDDTPGCTREACAFRDQYDEFTKRGVQVFGINPDSVESHQAFAEKYNLNFPLLSDTDKKVVKAYGVWGVLGGVVPITARRSFLIDPAGKVAKAYKEVNPGQHPEEILQDIP
jgi:peroxiredoxin Q/BCP